MDDRKRMNKKAFMDKKRYKNPKYGATAPRGSVVKHAPPRLDSNWKRYEENIHDDDSEEAPTFFDFDMLAQGPVSQGSYFQFKRDKYFMPDSDKLELDEMFSMDLRRISLAMQAVPFYERVGIDKNLLSEEEVIKMNELARLRKTEYDSFLNKTTNQSAGGGDLADDSDLIASIMTSIGKAVVSFPPDKEGKDKVVLTPPNSEPIKLGQVYEYFKTAEVAEGSTSAVSEEEKLKTRSMTNFKRVGKNIKDLPPVCLLRKEAKPFEGLEEALPSTSSLTGNQELNKSHMDLINSEKATDFPRLTTSQEKLFPNDEVDELEDWLDTVLD